MPLRPDNQDIDMFVQQEMLFFEGASRRLLNSTEEQRQAWRKETVMERRLRVSREVFELFGGRVRYGPFAGLQLGDITWWGQPDLGALMLGIYEKEILSLLFSSSFDDCDTFVSLGAADGYYPVGLVHAGRVSRALCFEISEQGQAAIASNASLNGVKERVEIYGKADSGFLSGLNIPKMTTTAILIDVEGAEFDILTQDVLSQLSEARIIIEIHNWIEDFADKYERFLRDASRHFRLERIKPVEREILSFPELDEFTDDNRFLLCSEGRPNLMRFLYLSPL